MAWDGSIRINTRLSEAGFNAGIKGMRSGFSTGIKSMIGNLGALTAALGITFGIAAVVAFGKAGVQAAAQMGSAFAGLKFIVDAHGKSFEEAKKFLDEFTSDGLVPMTSAVEAYKNMVSRGYDDKQISDMLKVMKDAASYSRQGQFSMGEAIEKTTQGLRMENSLLTDSVGVQTNVAKMWDQYARELGTVATSLTQAQKLQAEYNGFMKEGGVFAGAAAQYASTYAGKMSTLSASFLNLKVAIGNAIIPVINALLPSINAAIIEFTKLFNIVGRFMNLLFGTDVGMVDAAQATADATAETAANTEAAGKAAKGALASFDKLNVLAQATDAAGGTATTPTTSTPTDYGEQAYPVGDVSITGADKVYEFYLKVKTFFEIMIKDGWAAAFKDLFKLPSPEELNWILLGTIIDKIVQFFADVKNLGYEPAFDNLFGLPENTLSDIAAIVAVATLASGAIALIAPAIVAAFSAAFSAIVAGFFAVVAALGGGLVVAFALIIAALAVIIYRNWDGIVDYVEYAWLMMRMMIMLKIAEIKGDIDVMKAWFIQAWEDIKEFVKGAWDTMVLLIKLKIAEILGDIDTMKAWFKQAWEDIKGFFSGAWDKIKEIWGAVGAWFNNNVITPVKDFFTTGWDTISAKVTGVWDAVKLAWGDAVNWFQTTIINPISTAFETAWSAISGFVTGAFTGIGNTIKTAFNGVINFLNGLLNGITSGINSVIDLINSISFDIPQWAQTLFGIPSSVGFYIPPVYAPQIPYLATGAVIPANAPFAAVLGDHKSQTEILAPEDMIRRIVREESGRSNNTESGLIHNVIKLDGQVLYDAFKKIDKRVGSSMLAGSGVR